METLRYVRLFLKIAELGSLSAAGRALGLPHSSVSRQLSQLEAEVGARLIHRSTRSLSLTDAGHVVWREFLKAADVQATIEAELHPDMPTGTVRVTLSHAFALLMLLPALPAFTRRYPGVTVSLHVSNRREDLAGEGFDIAIRNGVTTDTALVGRKLGVTPIIVVASPTYLAAAGAPGSVPAIADHRVIAFQQVSEKPGRWTLTNGQQRCNVDFRPVLSVNDVQVVLGAAEQGMGIACLPARVCRDAFAQDRLVRCLPGWDHGSVVTYALYATRRDLRPSVRAFLDHLTGTVDFG